MALRLTLQVQLVLQALLRDPAREIYGLELSEETGLQPGTAYPILLRLEHEGWVTSRWEDIEPRAARSRPAPPSRRRAALRERRCAVSPREAAPHDARSRRHDARHGPA